MAQQDVIDNKWHFPNDKRRLEEMRSLNRGDSATNSADWIET